MRRALLALLAVAVLAPAAQAATPTRPVYDSKGRLVQAPFAPVVEPAALTEQRGDGDLPGRREGRGLARPVPERTVA